MTLNLAGKRLKTLDGIDLTGITILICSNNHLTKLPENLPDTLIKLDCTKNRLESLPSTLSPNLQDLVCDCNKLTWLPELPKTLKYLDCQNNDLPVLPDLPNSLKTLWYSDEYHVIPGHYKYISIGRIRLIQHNQKRFDLGLHSVYKIKDDERIRDEWQIWKYRIGGDKYLASL